MLSIANDELIQQIFSTFVIRQLWSFIKRQTSGTSSDNKWQRVVKRVTTNGNEWYNEWQQVVQIVTTNDNEWQWATISVNFSFFQIREEPTTNHPKENSLNLEEDLWRRPLELRAETSTQEKILTIASRNCRSSCSQIFIKISVLKNFAIFTGKHRCWSPFLRTLQVLNPANLLKGDSNTGFFLWILRNI